MTTNNSINNSLGAATATSLTLNGGTALASYSNGSWTPVPSNLTVVGTPSYTGSYVKIGAIVTCSMGVSSSTSTTSAQGTTSFTGLPYPPAATSTLDAINTSNGASIGTGAIFTTGSGVIYPPTWTTLAGVAMAFSYIATTN